jgi:hypothetical protein
MPATKTAGTDSSRVCEEVSVDPQGEDSSPGPPIVGDLSEGHVSASCPPQKLESDHGREEPADRKPYRRCKTCEACFWRKSSNAARGHASGASVGTSRPCAARRARRASRARRRSGSLPQQAGLSPQTPDQGPQLSVVRWPADPTAGAQTPRQSRHAARCHRRPVAGRTSITASRSELACVASVAISHRSGRRSRGCGDERRSTTSWWRSGGSRRRRRHAGRKVSRTQRLRCEGGRSPSDTRSPWSGRSSTLRPGPLNGPPSEFLRRTVFRSAASALAPTGSFPEQTISLLRWPSRVAAAAWGQVSRTQQNERRRWMTLETSRNSWVSTIHGQQDLIQSITMVNVSKDHGQQRNPSW